MGSESRWLSHDQTNGIRRQVDADKRYRDEQVMSEHLVNRNIIDEDTGKEIKDTKGVIRKVGRNGRIEEETDVYLKLG